MNRKTRTLILSGLCLLAPISASAINFTELLDEALLADSQYLEAKEKAYALSEAKWQGASALLPAIDITANALWNRESKQVHGQSEISVSDKSYQYTISLTQPIFDLDKLLGFKKGSQQAALAEIQLAQAWQELALRLAQAYFDALYARDVITSYDQQQDATAKFLDLAKKSFRIGTVTVSDVLEAESRLELVRAQLHQAMLEYELKRKALFVVLGREISELRPIAKDVQIQAPNPIRKRDWIEQAGSGNLDILAQKLALSLAETDLTKTKSSHLPTLSAIGSYNPQSQDRTLPSSLSSEPGPGLDTGLSYIGLQIRMPVFQGGYTLSKTRELAHTRNAQQEKLITTTRKTEESVEQYFNSVNSGIAKIGILRNALDLSKKSLKAAQLGYSVGVRSANDILNSEQQIASTFRDMSKATYDTILFEVKLKYAVGTLSLEEFSRLNNLLQ